MTKSGSPATKGTTPITELKSVDDVIERYQAPGPHATVVMRRALPGERGEDRHIRWHATQTDLRHHQADDAMIRCLDDAREELDRRGVHVLLTANAQSAAFCWLADHEVPSGIRVASHPDLLPALEELSDRAPAIGAIVDHVGADTFELGHLDLVETGSVKGDHVSTHRHTGGDQAGFQRRANQVYERNADLIAKELTKNAERAGAKLIVLTGDDREVASVEQHLDQHRFAVHTVQAGARHEPDSPARLHLAAREAALEERTRHRTEAVARLARELGQHDLAVAGQATTQTAISEGRVATLFLDASQIDEIGEANLLAKGALELGADVVVAPDIPAPDGVAGLLRYAYT